MHRDHAKDCEECKSLVNALKMLIQYASTGGQIGPGVMHYMENLIAKCEKPTSAELFGEAFGELVERDKKK